MGCENYSLSFDKSREMNVIGTGTRGNALELGYPSRFAQWDFFWMGKLFFGRVHFTFASPSVDCNWLDFQGLKPAHTV